MDKGFPAVMMRRMEKPLSVPVSVPAPDCQLCPRLAAFRAQNRARFPGRFNAPVPSFGSMEAGLLIVGLAPGLKGANFTGRPFTGDYAGDLLYPSLLKYGLATGEFKIVREEENWQGDTLTLTKARIANAVRCVPPQNKPTPEEAQTCRPFLVSEINAMPELKVILALGRVAHEAALRTLGLKLKDYVFAHGAMHDVGGGIRLANSYHCSRYNTNTGRLTREMFEDVVKACAAAL